MSKTKLFIGQWDIWAVTDGVVRVCPRFRFISGCYKWSDSYRTVEALESEDGLQTLVVNNFTEKDDLSYHYRTTITRPKEADHV